MSHTPGPWAINGWNIVQQDCDYTFPLLAKVCNGNRSLTLDAINANARLIAAAPELLAALKELVSYDEGCSEASDYGYEVLHRCKAAINKAEGRGE